MFRLSKGNSRVQIDRTSIKSLRMFLVIGLGILSMNAKAQDLQNENQIIDYLGMERYTSVLHSNPAYLDFLDVRCSNGFHIMDYVEEKMSSYQVLEVVKHAEWKAVEINGKDCLEFVETKVSPEQFLIDLEKEDFNFLEYKFSFDRKEVVYHVLGNTGKVILMVPTEQINKIVNKEI